MLKHKRALSICVGFLALSSLLMGARAGRAWQNDPVQENVRLFMRAKLDHMERIIEGLTVEDLDMVAKSAQQISLISQATQWQVFQTPEYVRRSGEFRREVDTLTEMAKNRNLDGATLAYLKVTMSCIECHKYVRGVRRVGLSDLPLHQGVQ
jgi:hypothetical protein